MNNICVIKMKSAKFDFTNNDAIKIPWFAKYILDHQCHDHLRTC